jgi:hypothetical protein
MELELAACDADVGEIALGHVGQVAQRLLARTLGLAPCLEPGPHLPGAIRPIVLQVPDGIDCAHDTLPCLVAWRWASGEVFSNDCSSLVQ